MNKKYWLRGGIMFSLVALIVAIPLGLFLFSSGLAGNNGVFISMCQSVFLVVASPGLFVKNFVGVSSGVGIFSALIFWFFIGSIVGWLYGETKNGNKNYLRGGIIGFILLILIIILLNP